MAFTQLVSFLSVPGEVIEPVASTSVDQNFAIVNEDLDDLDVRVWGNLLFCIYAPFPLQEYCVLRSVPLYNRSHIIFQPISVITGLNVILRFYANERSLPQNVTLWAE